MDESLATWLCLREPSDVAARSEALTRAVSTALDPDATLHALDLATGTGSNIRYLADRLPGHQRWLAVDKSPHLLADLLEHMSPWAAARGHEIRYEGNTCTVRGSRLTCSIETMQMDLATLSDRMLFVGRQLVTASALLDLVSESWLRSLVTHCRVQEAVGLFTITYNGVSSCDPHDPDDELVRGLFNRHQHTDKGLGGPAAGPEATTVAARCFGEVGFRVQRAPSDWTIAHTDHDMQRVLIDGWAHAAIEIDRRRQRSIAAWRERRLAHVDAGRSSMTVGHEDLAVWPLVAS